LSVHWQPITRIRQKSLPTGIRNILFDSGSLSVILEEYCKGEFNLQLVRQSWQRPFPDEAGILDLASGRYTLLREIFLRCDNIPLVYGRSIIPVHTFTGAERRLAHWGQRPLGDYLFSDKKVRRGQIEITQIPATHKLFQQGNINLPENAQSLWARRSLFYIKQKPLLVIEIFLPDLIKCMSV
jgi:chorismate lyase